MCSRIYFAIGIIFYLTCLQNCFAAEILNLRSQNVLMAELKSTNPDIDFKEIKQHTDFNLTTHIRIQQTFQGHRVFGADGVIHIPNNENTSLSSFLKQQPLRSTMNGIIYKGISADLVKTPHYVFGVEQEKKAIQYALTHFQKKSGSKQKVNNVKSNLIVYVDKNQIAHWVYWVSFRAKVKPPMIAKPNYFLDAATFKIYQEWDSLETARVKGGGYGGNPNIGRLIYDGTKKNLIALNMQREVKRQICFLKNAEIMVKDRRNKDATVQTPCAAKDATHNNVYWNADFDKANGGYSPSNDALFIGQIVKGMYHDWYGIPALVDEEGNPMLLRMRVHVPNYGNAYWDSGSMTFGDGDHELYPLTSLGVGAHEISHGFTEQHSNLIYDSQAGGLNESFSDMAAQAAEFYAYGHNSWQIGPEIFKQKGRALRYMDVPSKDCYGHEPGKDCSIDTLSQYREGLDVHLSSGVFNRLFYLLGTANNWGVRKAFDVMVKANQDYWTSTTTFPEAACGVLKAAQDYQYDLSALQSALQTVEIPITQC